MKIEIKIGKVNTVITDKDLFTTTPEGGVICLSKNRSGGCRLYKDEDPLKIPKKVTKLLDSKYTKVEINAVEGFFYRYREEAYG